jgi:F-type H+-transporting ATPase subunit a
MIFFSPLEQFEIFFNVQLLLFNFKHINEQVFCFGTNFDLSFYLAFLELFIFMFFFYETKIFFPNFVSFNILSFFSFCSSMLLGMVGVKALKNLALILNFFVFILVLNLLGLVPFGFCNTSQIILTQFLGFFAVFGLTLKGFLQLKFKLLFLFIPRNVPVFMLPFLTLIEIVSYISRMFSLSIRLFANMVAGHALLHILIGALLNVFNLAFITFFLGVLVLLPSLLIFSIMVLEIGIAFLQAYVFVVLFLIYLNDSIIAH